MDERENVSAIQGAIKPGVITGVAFIVFLLSLYVIDASLLAIGWLPLLALIAIIIAIVLFGVQFRKENGPYLSYGKAFTFLVVGFAIATLLSTSCNILMFEVVDPELKTYVGDLALENSIETQKRFGRTDEQIEANYEFIKQQTYDSMTAPSFLKRYFIIVFINAAISLLTALIVKKSEPIEDVY